MYTSKKTLNSKKNLTELFSLENIWRLALLGFMVASLYLQNNFITRNEFSNYQLKYQELEILLKKLETQNEIDIQQTKALELIDLRLRQLEQTTAILSNKIIQ
jgi:hypothetical protein